jgi:hypothetical protein
MPSTQPPLQQAPKGGVFVRALREILRKRTLAKPRSAEFCAEGFSSLAASDFGQTSSFRLRWIEVESESGDSIQSTVHHVDTLLSV